MQVIKAFSPDHALQQGINLLVTTGIEEDSRNGKVLVAPGPVATVYANSMCRVSFSPLRDANPFFHLVEALWMLGGRNDVVTPAYYAPRIASFSDDGVTLHGAYGFRWREYFGTDQLDLIIKELSRNPGTRRCVLAMWDGGSTDDDSVNHGDLVTAMSGGLDVPCNTHAYFMVRNGELDMTVCCRSNDIVWGAYGANVVHFSFLLEYMAHGAGLKPGTYTQMSNNYHAYIERPDVKTLFASGANPRQFLADAPTPLRSPSLFESTAHRKIFDRELNDFLDRKPGDYPVYTSPFLNAVAVPMATAFALYKADALQSALYRLQAPLNADYDWLSAGRAWIQRRIDKRAAAQEVRP